MARSGKTITFATDLLPNEDNTYQLGLQDENTPANNRRWLIYGSLNGTATKATAANINSSTNGIAYYSNTTGAFASTSAGPDGYILIGKGNTANPTWYEGLTLTTASGVYTATLGSNNDANLIIKGTTTITGATDLNGATTIGTSSATASLTMYGNIIPQLNNNNNPIYTLGTSNNHWNKLYIGATNSHGDQYTPIYWNDGKPEVTTPIQRINFTVDKDHLSPLKFSNNAITTDTSVLEIVVTGGYQWLHGPIEWDNIIEDNTRKIQLTIPSPITEESAATTKIYGYIKIAHTATMSS